MERIEKINAILAERGMSGADLSRLIGVSNGVYSQWNTKQTKPRNSNLKKIADVLEVDISELFADDEKTIKKPAPQIGDGQNEKDKRLIDWFRSLPEEKQKAILTSQDAPEGLV